MIKYEKKIERRLLTDEEANKLTSLYPLKEAVFIPYVKEEFRGDAELADAGAFNDRLISDILDSLNLKSYNGTYQYTNVFYSDYFESVTDFINILYYEENDCLIIGAIFYTNKLNKKS